MRELSNCELDHVCGGLVYKGITLKENTQTNPSQGSIDNFTKAIDHISMSSVGQYMLDKLFDNKVTVNLDYNANGDFADVYTDTVIWNPTIGVKTTDGDRISPAIFLAHELAHLFLEEAFNLWSTSNGGFAFASNIIDKDAITYKVKEGTDYYAVHELFAVGMETLIATELNVGTRDTYGSAGPYEKFSSVTDSTKTDEYRSTNHVTPTVSPALIWNYQPINQINNVLNYVARASKP